MCLTISNKQYHWEALSEHQSDEHQRFPFLFSMAFSLSFLCAARGKRFILVQCLRALDITRLLRHRVCITIIICTVDYVKKSLKLIKWSVIFVSKKYHRSCSLKSFPLNSHTHGKKKIEEVNVGIITVISGEKS